LFSVDGVRELRPWRWRLLYVGRFDRRKGVDTLLRAIPLLPAESKVMLYGRGSETDRARVENLARALGIEERVEIRASDRAELVAAYSGADVCIFPSEWEEPFGLVPLEAMACGTPVVATGTGGSGEFLSHGENSVLFRAGDP